jgi:hypothetical protein
MKVIGAGFGRTGTTSLKAALEELGFGPCYHMKEVFENPKHTSTWMAATEGRHVDWKEFFKDYQATVDWPGASFYKELMEVYPDAKVLLSVRDPEAWYKSCINTIHKISQTFPMSWTMRFVPVMGRMIGISSDLVWKNTFHGRFLDKEYALELFRQHNEEVKRYVPADRLLVYDVAEGWEPLCRFLGVPVPEGKPFPRLNDTKEFQRFVRISQVVSSVPLVLALVAGLGLLRLLLPRR